jgi:5'-deoxynucleotidase YfbR-like HD superfamily hydrolase
LFAFIIAELENEAKTYDYYNIGEVLKKAVIHDIEESETGDILFPVKHNPQLKDIFEQLITAVVDKSLFSELDEVMKYKFTNLWKSSKDGSKEGRLISAIDKFELLIFATTELELGNKAMVPIFNTAIKIITEDYYEITTLQKIVNHIYLKTTGNKVAFNFS